MRGPHFLHMRMANGDNVSFTERDADTVRAIANAARKAWGSPGAGDVRIDADPDHPEDLNRVVNLRQVVSMHSDVVLS